MSSRIARLALLAAFIVAVGSGPVLALCQPDLGSVGCCCSGERKCPRPTSAQAAAEACCKAAPPAVPATSGQDAGDRSGTSSADANSLHTTAAAAPAAASRHARHLAPAADGITAGVGLYTLHAAFLI